MLKFTEATEAKNRVAAAQRQVSAAQDGLVEMCNQLYSLRSEVGRSLVADFEYLVNSLASRPKSYDRTLALFHYNLQQFDREGQAYSDYISQEIRDAATEGGAGAGLGVAAGAATAFAAPTAALAVATTFGTTATTGVAISTLSGAALNSAALAWLGGGALAAGGGGMAAGNALLALAGPVGLALAGVSVAGGLGWAAYKNRDTIETALHMEEELSAALLSVRVSAGEVSGLYGLTVEHTHSLRQLLTDFSADAPKDYLLFSDRQKEMLGAMHNHVLALGRLLKLKPGELADLATPVDDSDLPQAEPRSDYTPNFVLGSSLGVIEVGELTSKFLDGVR